MKTETKLRRYLGTTRPYTLKLKLRGLLPILKMCPTYQALIETCLKKLLMRRKFTP